MGNYSYSRLGIYRAMYRLALHIEECAKKFKRADKYTIGAELRHAARLLVCKIRKINRIKDEEKIAYLDKLKDELDDLDVTLSMCGELSVFSSYGEWFSAVEMLSDVSEQLKKLTKYFNERQNQRGIRPQ